MRKQLLLLLFSLFAVMGFARTVTGVVVQASDKEPIIGATIQVHGTTKGTATDIDGKFTLDVKDGDVLDVSYVGMNPLSIKVGNQSTFSIEMKENSQVLKEVVVTAMGQTQEKKKLNFAVQSLNNDQVTAGGSSNFVNSLQGKVAGLQVSTGGGSPNSSSQVIIRAISSINSSQSNEPLIIIDGMPVRGKGSSLADINPDDIENMSVLKGAAASALYGQEAANGVIMITTKSGNKSGEVTVNGTATVEISTPMRVPKTQCTFLSGSYGFYKENSASGGWGPYARSTDKICEYITKAWQEQDIKNLVDYEHMGYTLVTLSVALWAYWHTSSFEEGLLAVVNAGGDADTNAAIACAILGAKYGFSSIPTEYVDGLLYKEQLERVVNDLASICIKE